jgi:hypothetical protein
MEIYQHHDRIVKRFRCAWLTSGHNTVRKTRESADVIVLESLKMHGVGPVWQIPLEEKGQMCVELADESWHAEKFD